jgi:hypothetical protein
MKKDITICFRTDKAIRISLEKIAKEGRQTISAVIESILFNHLKEEKVLQGIKEERRGYTRKQVSLPAFVMEANSENKTFHAAKVMDISLGGIRLSIPQGLNMAVCRDNETNELHILFTLPEATQPINVKCKPQCICEYGGDIQIGAAFIDSDFNSYQTLQRHLM